MSCLSVSSQCHSPVTASVFEAESEFESATLGASVFMIVSVFDPDSDLVSDLDSVYSLLFI